MNLDADPYRTLGLTRGASLDEVKRAYRRLAKANHPDAAGAAALPRFLAIHAAYEQLLGGSASTKAGPASAAARRRPSAADAERADATRRAYGGRPREPRPGSGPADGPRSRPRGSTAGSQDGRAGAQRPGADAAPPPGPDAGPRPGARRGSFTGRRAPGGAAGAAGAERGAGASAGSGPSGSSDAPPSGGSTQASPARGKATLGSTSYDGADAGPFEPDWGGASWYGTTSGTYWTINPKEYADPRKHGPEYQARARRAAGARGAAPGADLRADPRADGGPPGSPTHTTSSWWDSTAGPEPEDGSTPDGREDSYARGEPAASAAFETEPRDEARRTRYPHDERAPDFDEPAPDPARAAIDLGRALTDPRSGGLRGRAVRAVLGWLPIALGLGWLIGELTGCGRFAATCDPAVGPLTAAGQAIVLLGLFLVPEIAAIAAGAALVLLAAATAATLILSATGTAADEGSRRAALAALLVIAWLSGLAIAVVRRVRSGVRPARPVS
jgi:hypothetical protein